MLPLCRSTPISNLPKSYRVYCFDIDRRAVSADFIKAGSDQEAVTKIQAAGFGSKCEIWDGKRLVAQLESEQPPASRLGRTSVPRPAF